MFWCGYDEKPVKKNLLIFWKKHILEKTKRIIYMVEWGANGRIYIC